MVDRIHLNDLHRMLEDDGINDAALAPYFEYGMSSLPMQPLLRLNPDLVEVPDTRGLMSIAIGVLNGRSARRRAQAFEERVAAGFDGLRLFAEGDSWFQFPLLRRDVVDHLSADFAVYCTSAAGDTLENMTSGLEDTLQLIGAHRPDAFLFSGGGNDIAGDELGGFLRAASAAAKPEDLISEAFDQFLRRLSSRLLHYFNGISRRYPKLPILCHGYDWPYPRAGGRWLFPAFEERGIPAELRMNTLRLMIDRYYETLAVVADSARGPVTVVDCRGAVGDESEWFDELHPWDGGYGRVAARFTEALHHLSPAEVEVADISGVEVSWYPRSDSSRRASKSFPIGAVISVGRQADQEIMLEDDRVSREHARLAVMRDHVRVEDLNSSNGTYVADKRVEQAKWAPGETLDIGIFRFDIAWSRQQAMIADRGAIPLHSDDATNEPQTINLSNERLRLIELNLIQGNIANVSSPAYALGVFDHVKPGGAAAEIDELMGNRLSAFIQAQVFGRSMGEISLIPTPRQRTLTEHVVFVGLGAISEFKPHILETVAAKLARVTTLSQLHSIATVPIGLRSGCRPAEFAEHFITGFLKGLKAADPFEEFNKLDICEIDKISCDDLEFAIESLKDHFAQHGFAIQFTRSEVSSLSYRVGKSDANSRSLRPVYLEVRSPLPGKLEFSLLSSGHGAAIRPVLVDLDMDIDSQLRRAMEYAREFDEELGTRIADHFLTRDLQQQILQSLESSSDSHLVVIHDHSASAVPWEALYFDGVSPALSAGLSRIYKSSAEGRSGGHRSATRSSTLRMLVIQDPTGDLPGAENEGEELARFFRTMNGEVTILHGADATVANITDQISAGSFDIVHFAGHADYDETNPANSGMLCPDGRLVAAHWEKARQPPQLLFINGCESSRMRSPTPAPPAMLAVGALKANVSLAEHIMLNGVPNFVGTYWPVNDLKALQFSTAFYKALLGGHTVGAAVRDGRQATMEGGSRDWANYQHFGDPTYRLRFGTN